MCKRNVGGWCRIYDLPTSGCVCLLSRLALRSSSARIFDAFGLNLNLRLEMSRWVTVPVPVPVPVQHLLCFSPEFLSSSPAGSGGTGFKLGLVWGWPQRRTLHSQLGTGREEALRARGCQCCLKRGAPCNHRNRVLMKASRQTQSTSLDHFDSIQIAEEDNRAARSKAALHHAGPGRMEANYRYWPGGMSLAP